MPKRALFASGAWGNPVISSTSESNRAKSAGSVVASARLVQGRNSSAIRGVITIT